MRILISGLSHHSTGLGGVLAALRSDLASRHFVKTLCFGDPVANLCASCKDLGTISGYMAAGRFAVDQQALDECLCDVHIVIVIGSVFTNEVLLLQIAKSKFRRRVYVIFYVAIEGKPASPVLLDLLTIADACAFYTQAAMSGVQAMIDGGHENALNFNASLHLVGHGVEVQHLSDLGLRRDRAECLEKRRVFWAAESPTELVVLNVAKPYLRKRLDLSISAFGLFRRHHQDARLLLATGPLSDMARDELTSQINREGVKDNVELLEDVRSLRDMNLLYNVADIGLSTSAGEGWGLPLFEHAATGAPIVAPEHTTFMELWNRKAILAPVTHSYADSFEFSQMFAVDPLLISEALIRLSQPSERASWAARSAAALKNARLKWSDVAHSLLSIVTSAGGLCSERSV